MRSRALLIAGGVATAAASLLLLTSCGLSGGSDDAAAHPQRATVTITSRGYRPRVVRIGEGGTVTWVNRGFKHVTAETVWTHKHAFDTHTILRGERKSVRFEHPGRYEYFSSYGEPSGGVVLVEDE